MTGGWLEEYNEWGGQSGTLSGLLELRLEYEHSFSEIGEGVIKGAQIGSKMVCQEGDI